MSPACAAARSGGPASSILVERPASRLSKRMTWKPPAASSSHKPSSHPIICAPRPLTRRRGAALGSPNVSYSMSIPFARTWGIGPIVGLCGALNLSHRARFAGRLDDRIDDPRPDALRQVVAHPLELEQARSGHGGGHA